MQELFDAVRRACPAAVWSRGVELNRAASVHFERAEDEEVVFRVSSRGGMISRAVTFFLDDGEWECECDAAGEYDDPCCLCRYERSLPSVDCRCQ